MQDDEFTQVKETKNLQGTKKQQTMAAMAAQPQTNNNQMTQKPKPVGKNKKINSKKYNPNYIKTKFLICGEVRSEWKPVDSLMINQVEGKDNIEEKITDLFKSGTFHEFNPAFIQKITPKNSLTCSRAITQPTISTAFWEDPFFMSFQNEGYQFPEDQGRNVNYFFMTEEILGTLATSHRSNFPWNIFFVKDGNRFYFFADGEDDSTLLAKIHTYNENYNGDLPEDEKIVVQQCREAHLVCENFAKQSLKADKFVELNEKLAEDLPTLEENPSENLPKGKLYSYKRIELNSQNVIICRFTVDGYDKVGEEVKPVLIRAVNDIGKGMWISRWDRDSIKNEVIKDNICKFFKWMLFAFINKISDIKLAYSTKVDDKKEDFLYKLIKVDNVSVQDLCKNFNFQSREFFASLNMVLNKIGEITNEGQHAINKTQFKNDLTIYFVPEAKEQDEEKSEDEDKLAN